MGERKPRHLGAREMSIAQAVRPLIGPLQKVREKLSKPHERRRYHVKIETTTACQLRCAKCPRDSLTRAVPTMPEETFEKIVERIAEMSPKPTSISLNRFGEALIDKQIGKHVAAVTQFGVPVSFVTNGMLLDERRAREILDAGLDTLTISFDGATAETFEVLREGSKFDTICTNLKRFLALRDEMQGKTKLCLNIAMEPRNEPEVRDIYRIWGPLVDGIALFPTYNYQGTQNTTFFKSNGKNHVARKGKCPDVGTMLTILTNGDCIVCCRGDINGELVVGNIHESSLDEIWRSEEMTKLVNLNRDRRLAEVPLCGDCDFTREELTDGFIASSLLGKRLELTEIRKPSVK